MLSPAAILFVLLSCYLSSYTVTRHAHYIEAEARDADLSRGRIGGASKPRID